MGRRDRERIERIREGKEEALALASRLRNKQETMMSRLQSSSTSNQVQFLAQSLDEGKLSPNKLRRELESSARREMLKGGEKIAKSGKTPTVKELLKEYYHEKSFKNLAERVGLTEDWFVQLAETECARWETKQQA